MNAIARTSGISIFVSIFVGIGIFLLSMGLQDLDPFIPSYLSGFPLAPYAQLEVILFGVVIIVSPFLLIFFCLYDD